MHLKVPQKKKKKKKQKTEEATGDFISKKIADKIYKSLENFTTQ